MPEAIGENIEVVFTCVCCQRTVCIWAFQPVHPDTSNTEYLPDKWRQNYRQFWYVNPVGNQTFDQGQLFRIEMIDQHPILMAASLSLDGNPYVQDLVHIPPQGIGVNRVVWVCAECHKIGTADPVYLWKPILTLIKQRPSS